MTKIPNRPRRQRRLPEYDYSSSGAYFVTICTHLRRSVFGDIIDSKMQLNQLGDMANLFWNEIPNHFANAILDEHVIMPNHIHGILILKDSASVGIQYIESLQNHFQHIIPKSLGSIIRTYKSSVTR